MPSLVFFNQIILLLSKLVYTWFNFGSIFKIFSLTQFFSLLNVFAYHN